MFSDFPEDNSFFLDAGMQAASEHLGGKKIFMWAVALSPKKRYDRV